MLDNGLLSFAVSCIRKWIKLARAEDLLYSKESNLRRGRLFWWSDGNAARCRLLRNV